MCILRATPYPSLQQWLAGRQAAALCGDAYCLSSNQWIPAGGDTDCGGLGWIIAPDGTVLAQTSPDEPFVTLDMDLGLARNAKTSYPRYVAE